jgi:hypothetical protein
MPSIVFIHVQLQLRASFVLYLAQFPCCDKLKGRLPASQRPVILSWFSVGSVHQWKMGC